jgi:hypothetical protein
MVNVFTLGELNLGVTGAWSHSTIYKVNGFHHGAPDTTELVKITLQHKPSELQHGGSGVWEVIGYTLNLMPAALELIGDPDFLKISDATWQLLEGKWLKFGNEGFVLQNI